MSSTFLGDVTTRLVYSDWLEENGEHEEAERQRRWVAAKNWLVQFCEKNNPEDEDAHHVVVTYRKLIELGHEAVALRDKAILGWLLGENEKMEQAYWSDSDEIWRNWSIVTGVPAPPEVEDDDRLNCPC